MNAQSGNVDNTNIYYPNFSVPSAEAYNFTRVGEIPVNESSGNATVDIPLYTYECGKINVPLSVFHSGGAVRVNEENNILGINWQLNAGGLITRTVNDKVDENTTFGNKKFPLSSSSISSVELYAIADAPSVDSEVDIFNFNFNGYSGSFFIDPTVATNNNIPPENIKLIKYDNELKIEISAPLFDENILTDKRTITITTPDGIKYFFGGLAASESTKINYLNQTNNLLAQTAFHLFKIENVFGDIVQFEYLQELLPGTDEKIIGYNQSLVIDESIEGQGALCIPVLNNSAGELSAVKPYFLVSSGKLRLSKIKSNNDGKSDFIDRIIFNYSEAGTEIGGYQLNDIKIYDYNSVLFKKIDFLYEYPSIPASNSNTIPNIYFKKYTKRFFLSAIKIFQGLNTGTDFAYSFEYNNPHLLPARFSFSQDYAGYFNGAINLSFVPNIQSYIPTNSIVEAKLANLTVNSNVSSYGALTKINYPTKGYTLFEYETGQSTTSPIIYNSSNLIYYSRPGIRIRSISQFAGNNSNPIIKRYYYNDFANVSSNTDSNIQTRTPRYTGRLKIVSSCSENPSGTSGQICYPYKIEKKIIYSNPQNSIYLSDFNKSVYQYVTVSYGGDGFENGGKQSKYAVNSDAPANPHSMNNEYAPDTKSSNNSLKNGTLMEEIYFKSGATYENNVIVGKVKEVINTYFTDDSKSTSTNNWFASKFCSAASCSPLGNLNSVDNYFISNYNIFSWWHTLESTTTKEYLNDKIVETKINYYYNGDDIKLAGLPSSTVTTLGTESLETKYHYPPFTSMQNQPNVALLKNKFIISTPLAIENYRNGVKNFEQRTIYGTNYLPKDIYAAKFPNDLYDLALTGKLEKKVTFNSYDNKGNVTQFTPENGIPVSIIWAYQKNKMVAKLENISYDIIPNNLITNIQNATDSPTSSEANIKLALNALRSNTNEDLKKSFISTFAYKSMLGVGSVTDPKGEERKFEYDAYGRLKYVKDKDGNIITETISHFNNPNAVLNTAISQSFTPTNCFNGSTPLPIIYTVEAGTYSGTTQIEANTLAQNDININGQNFANNQIGRCLFTNSLKTQNGILKTNCPDTTVAIPYTYWVLPGTHYSNISQIDADNKALNDISLNGLNAANAYGFCSILNEFTLNPIFSSEYGITSLNASIAISNNTVRLNFKIPAPTLFNVDDYAYPAWTSPNGIFIGTLNSDMTRPNAERNINYPPIGGAIGGATWNIKIATNGEITLKQTNTVNPYPLGGGGINFHNLTYNK